MALGFGGDLRQVVAETVDTITQFLNCYIITIGNGRTGSAGPSKAHAGMKWFRSNVRHGSRLALFSLAVQFVLAFGHFHAVAAQRAGWSQSGAAQTESSLADQFVAPEAFSQSAQTPQPASDHDSDHQPRDTCAICAVITLANTVLFAVPPMLLLPQAGEFFYLASDAEFVHLNSDRVAFQPRAPPVS
jgi:hypothetical protein